MHVGRRTLSDFAQRVADTDNHRAILRFFSVHYRPVVVIAQEVLSLGAYPRTLTVKTPMGDVRTQLYSPADLSTLNLVFCREDYYAPPTLRTVVDIGSNIGLSALYWLSRNADAFVHCWEPAPVSYDRLVGNLTPFEGRFVAHRKAVSNFGGAARLGIEPSGVYSSLKIQTGDHVECEVVHINDVLEESIGRDGRISVLKIDSEGHEIRTLKAIDPTFWPRIDCVNVDCRGAARVVPEGFEFSRKPGAERFHRRG